MAPKNDVVAQLGFLSRKDIYRTEKPYRIRFAMEGVPQTNIVGEKHQVSIVDARSQNMSFEDCGFCLSPFSTAMDYSDFEDPVQVKHTYCAEIASTVKQVCGASHARVMDFAIRRRDKSFPISTGVDYKHQQPAAMVHLDFTPKEAAHMISTLYQSQAEELMSSGWAIINAWRPLKEPVRDWPLAVCDCRTFDSRRDGVAADVVYHSWVSENVMVHHCEEQEWFFFPEQSPDELLIFRGVNSAQCLDAACPHGAFQPFEPAPDTALRESIDCRVMVFYTKEENLPPEVGTLYGAKP